MNMAGQLIIIPGGEAFDSDDAYLEWLQTSNLNLKTNQGWKYKVQQDFTNLGWEVFYIDMPCAQNANYDEWVIAFEKILPALGSNVVLVGHSLGGIFLASYLAQHLLKVKQLHLIAAPFERVATFELPNILLRVNQNCNEIYVWHSVEDYVVPFVESQKYLKQLPKAKLMQFVNKGHFNQNNFSELVDVISNI